MIQEKLISCYKNVYIFVTQTWLSLWESWHAVRRDWEGIFPLRPFGAPQHKARPRTSQRERQVGDFQLQKGIGFCKWHTRELQACHSEEGRSPDVGISSRALEICIKLLNIENLIYTMLIGALESERSVQEIATSHGFLAMTNLQHCSIFLWFTKPIHFCN